MKKILALIFFLLFSSTCLALSPIKVTGNQLSTDNQRFIPLGVDHQPKENVDPLSDDNVNYVTNTLIPKLKEMGVNAIRVYQVCPGGSCSSHKAVMQALDTAGIYVFVELADYKNGTDCTINRDTGEYPGIIYQCFTKKIDEFAQYPNVMAFSVGNEVWLKDSPKKVAAVEKALIRDMKAYIKDKKYRAIPVGSVLRDVPDVTIPIAYYLACNLPNEKQDTSADFIGYNTYRWGGSETDEGGYPAFLNGYNGYASPGDALKNGFDGINVPIIFTEFGRQNISPRFGEVNWLFGKGLNLISGGMAFRLVQKSGEAEFGIFADESLTQPTQAGGFDSLKDKYNLFAKKTYELGGSVTKNICTADKYKGMDGNFELNPDALPTHEGGGDFTVHFYLGNLNPPIKSLILSYTTDPQMKNWKKAGSIDNPSATTEGTAQIPNPETLTALSIAYQVEGKTDTFGACLVQPANKLCGGNACTKEGLSSIYAAWSSNGQGACQIK